MLNRIPIKYTTDGLVITIPSASPGAAHENILRGIVAGIKGHLHDNSKTPADSQQLAHLVDFLEIALPDEKQLNKSFE